MIYILIWSITLLMLFLSIYYWTSLSNKKFNIYSFIYFFFWIFSCIYIWIFLNIFEYFWLNSFLLIDIQNILYNLLFLIICLPIVILLFLIFSFIHIYDVYNIFYFTFINWLLINNNYYIALWITSLIWWVSIIQTFLSLLYKRFIKSINLFLISVFFIILSVLNLNFIVDTYNKTQQNPLTTNISQISQKFYKNYPSNNCFEWQEYDNLFYKTIWFNIELQNIEKNWQKQYKMYINKQCLTILHLEDFTLKRNTLNYNSWNNSSIIIYKFIFLFIWFTLLLLSLYLYKRNKDNYWKNAIELFKKKRKNLFNEIKEWTVSQSWDAEKYKKGQQLLEKLYYDVDISIYNKTYLQELYDKLKKIQDNFISIKL